MSNPDGKRKSLGRGLSALLGDEDNDYARLEQLRASKTVAVDQLRPGRFQPRRRMDEADLEELAQSIAARGVLQPLLVRRHPDEDGAYEIIAGERRWRAAQKARLHEVPVVVKDFTDGEALEIALVENLQREDLTALEEAEGYRRLTEEFAHTQEDLSYGVAKSRSHIANLMRLLSLPESVKALLDEGKLSTGHARALLSAHDPEGAARIVVKGGLNVRQTERLIKTVKGKKPRAQRRAAAGKNAESIALERDLGNLLGLAVEVQTRGAGGSLTLHFSSLEQLDALIHRLHYGPRGNRPYIAPTDDDDIAAADIAAALAADDALGEDEDFAAADEEAGDETSNEAAPRPS